MRRFVVAGALLVASACTGTIDGTPGSFDDGSPGAAPGNGGSTSLGGRGSQETGVAPPPGASPVMDPTAGACGAVTLGPSPLRRLTAAEYARTARDLLGLPPDAPIPAAFPDDSRIDGFENN